jgi:hypothetical protein
MSILPNLYYAWKGTKHLRADELHKRYGMVEIFQPEVDANNNPSNDSGEVVRMEPGFLSIISPDAVQGTYMTIE